jgi:photosystem I P700 chlorophyll a apoprotein A2
LRHLGYISGGILLVCAQTKIYTLVQFLALGATAFAGWLHLQPKFQPGLSWFKNAESRLNHHLSGLFGFSSLAWTGHLVHVAIPAWSTRSLG